MLLTRGRRSGGGGGKRREREKEEIHERNPTQISEDVFLEVARGRGGRRRGEERVATRVVRTARTKPPTLETITERKKNQKPKKPNKKEKPRNRNTQPNKKNTIIPTFYALSCAPTFWASLLAHRHK